MLSRHAFLTVPAVFAGGAHALSNVRAQPAFFVAPLPGSVEDSLTQAQRG